MRARAAVGIVVWIALLGAAPARAQEGELRAPAMRVGVSGGLGFVLADADAMRPDGPPEPVRPGSGGFALELRGGVQITEWLAFDLALLAETLLFYGDARASAHVEIAPHPQVAFGLGAGVGSLYVGNLYYKSPSADFATGIFRVEVRIPDEQLMVVFVDAQLGVVIGGDVPGGTLVGGARAGVGFLTWP